MKNATRQEGASRMRAWSPHKPGAPEVSDVATEGTTLATVEATMPKVDVVALLAELPMQQGSVSRALVVLDDPNASAQDIAAVLESDPALCARALQLANSAHFGLSGRVTSVDQAVVTLGATAMRTLVVSTAAGVFGRPDDLPAGFWDHSVAVAAATAMAARLCGVTRGDAICAGLLHDLGAALLFRYDRSGYGTRLAVGSDAADRLLDDETRTYGADHATLGAEALAAWNLPPSIIEALRTHHHEPQHCDSKLARVVIAGEALAHAAFASPPFAHEPAQDPAAVFDALGLRVASVEMLVTRAAEETEILAQMLGTH
jgi:putative nucleotidyltransferase with HDIG domain